MNHTRFNNLTQVENAIEIASNPTADRNLKSQALSFISQLPSQPESRQICLSLFLREPRCSEVVRHTSLDVLDNVIGSGKLDSQALNLIRENLMAYARGMYGVATTSQATVDSSNLQNKLAQTFAFLFITLYPSDWLSFFADILALTATDGSSLKNNATGTVFFLRVLIQIHDEIADVYVSRSSDERRKGNDLKDLIRQRDARTIAASWQEVLLQWKGKDSKVIELCLATIGRWVSWTDISLIITETLRDQLLELVIATSPSVNGSVAVRETALTTLTEILRKKMSPDYKLELIEFLKIRDVVAHLVSSPALADLRATSQYDTDLAESVAQLVNHSLSDIVKALESAPDRSPVMLQAVSQLKGFLPLVLRFFSDEYDEICSTVIACLSDLLTLFRKKKSIVMIHEQSAAMLAPILDAVVVKMRYDETSSWGNEDAQTDEAEFQELRKRLHVLQQTVAAVDQDLFQDKISRVVITALENFQADASRVDWRDVDLAMHEMFLFGELGLKNGGLYSKARPTTPAAERLIGMMFKLVETG